MINSTIEKKHKNIVLGPFCDSSIVRGYNEYETYRYNIGYTRKQGILEVTALFASQHYLNIEIKVSFLSLINENSKQR